MRCAWSALVLILCSCEPSAPRSTLIVWAWERTEDLRFLPGDVEIAVQTGFVELSGETLAARGRHHPLHADRAPDTALVHIQIDPKRPLHWTPMLRQRTRAAVLHLATQIPAPRVQIDFEVRESERGVLLDLLHDVRAALPRDTRLSLTALASWCDEGWIARAPVDEIVPMLFRMGRGDRAIRARLGGGGDFRAPRCRTALGIATDTPIPRAPPGRRVYMFAPMSWTPGAYRTARAQVEAWR